MLDFGHIPTPYGSANVQLFTGSASVTGLQWQTWMKPRGKTMMFIMAASGGAGGGAGFSRAAAAAGGGGGAGGSSGLVRVTLPLILVPDVLYIQGGAGGTGGVPGGAAATAGTLSFVAARLSASSPGIHQASNTLIQSSGANPGIGVAGSGTAAGTGGVAATVVPATNGPLALIGHFDAVAGAAGASGGAQTGAIGGASSYNAAVPVWGATGGAGTTSADFAGGAFTAVTDSYFSEMRPATPAAGSFDGSTGRTVWQPFYSYGGGGGSSSNTGPGGNGGNGGYGCGGGGGGAGTTGGRGGDGGPGFVLIVCW